MVNPASAANRALYSDDLAASATRAGRVRSALTAPELAEGSSVVMHSPKARLSVSLRY
ncbi:hypothetical protein Mkiyose1088_05890 [Mycobacterium kiyosense]|nr:hypothetical protein MKCMC460_62230 [Mycobacterium sp. 20KCMC460]GLC98722.1 hypothetical protein Mkiyose1088_05890 [Mycobacterium kiyosense]GLD20886.1 hypothetical protein Mkiyose1385_49850 [Mycobacterium kiyosense]